MINSLKEPRRGILMLMMLAGGFLLALEIISLCMAKQRLAKRMKRKRREEKGRATATDLAKDIIRTEEFDDSAATIQHQMEEGSKMTESVHSDEDGTERTSCTESSCSVLEDVAID